MFIMLSYHEISSFRISQPAKRFSCYWRFGKIYKREINIRKCDFIISVTGSATDTGTKPWRYLWPEIHAFHLNGYLIFLSRSPPRQMKLSLQHKETCTEPSLSKWEREARKLWRIAWSLTWISN